MITTQLFEDVYQISRWAKDYIGSIAQYRFKHGSGFKFTVPAIRNDADTLLPEFDCVFNCTVFETIKKHSFLFEWQHGTTACLLGISVDTRSSSVVTVKEVNVVNIMDIRRVLVRFLEVLPH